MNWQFTIDACDEEYFDESVHMTRKRVKEVLKIDD
jgi:hypothetical protein